MVRLSGSENPPVLAGDCSTPFLNPQPRADETAPAPVSTEEHRGGHVLIIASTRCLMSH